MNPKCHRCTKTVYPVEKLNCLDKTWHKGCFNCEVCHMTLTMKTYKGYKKLPYCNTHYPTTKFTAVADTPENMRLKKNTSNQSTVVYHKDFEQEKGKYTAVTDDPETLRTRKTQEQASDIAYQSKAATKSQTPAARDDPHKGRSTSQSQEEYTPAEPEEVPAPPVAPSGGGGRYVAVYDYTAADDDEVTFVEGDYIVNGQIIDEGWMTGTVESTGQTGMLPSNYVEAC